MTDTSSTHLPVTQPQAAGTVHHQPTAPHRDENAQKKAKRRNAFAAVFGYSARYWARHKALFGVVLVLATCGTMMDVMIPLFSGRLIDAVTGTRNDATFDAAVMALMSMIALGVSAVTLRHLAYLGVVRMTLLIMSQMALDSFWRVQRFATDWHANTFAGSTVRKVTRGMWAIDTLNDNLLLALWPACVVLLGSTVLLGWHWPMMGLAVFAGAVIYIGMTLFLTVGYVGPAASLSNQWDTRTGGALADAISCNAVVKSFGNEAREDQILGRVIAKWRRRTTRTWKRATVNGSSQAVMLLSLRALIIGMAIWLWWEGRATTGEVAYVLTTYLVIQGYLYDIGAYIRDVQRAVNDMEELVAIHDTPFGVEDGHWAKPIEITKGEIVFDRVTFHYGGHVNPLYQDFSVTIRPGEKVGLVGLSGSGKTTFVKLIQRLYDIQSGEIRIDGQNVAKVQQASLRAQIALVQQEPILFHRSLAENIAYAKPGASLEEIEAAAKLANAHDFIAKLPKGYQTLVGERGVKLSGGERQRVALARAFLADAPILILDEATSSLDSESEHLIQEATARLIEGRTAIVIAHRLSTVRALERILIFDQGRIVEEGDHETLIGKQDGLYRRLFDRQVLGLVDSEAA
ncbi:ABC transporter ATP-binding protein [Dongia sp.]|uniref:ABC transporter ATP-binding protein n=1 Tax=Dongia sp. TaxID=1977262 RepID=UPI0035B282DD